MERQSELAGRRVRQRRIRLQQHEEYRKEPQVAKDNVPSAGGWGCGGSDINV